MKRETRKFELDFSECSTWGEIYREIKKKLELPDWCGENLDALWDAMTGMMYTPAQITVSKKVKNTVWQQMCSKLFLYYMKQKRSMEKLK